MSAGKGAAVITRLWGDVPVPDIIVHGDSASVFHVPYALMRFVPGVRIEEPFGALKPGERAILGRALGRTLAGIYGATFEQAGSLDEDLAVVTPLPSGGDGMSDVLENLLETGVASERLGAERCGAMRRHVTERSDRFDAWPDKPCLVHGDFGASNILIAADGAEIDVAVVLDWELALAATPALDLGNLIRPPLGDAADLLDHARSMTDRIVRS